MYYIIWSYNNEGVSENMGMIYKALNLNTETLRFPEACYPSLEAKLGLSASRIDEIFKKYLFNSFGLRFSLHVFGGIQKRPNPSTFRLGICQWARELGSIETNTVLIDELKENNHLCSVLDTAHRILLVEYNDPNPDNQEYEHEIYEEEALDMIYVLQKDKIELPHCPKHSFLKRKAGELKIEGYDDFCKNKRMYL
jgi:hypothetical protein